MADVSDRELKADSLKKLRQATDPMEKLRLQCLSRGSAGIKGLGRAFRIMDDDESRKLELDEFIKGLGDYGLDLTEEEAKSAFAQVDADGSGTVDFDEFLIALRPPMSAARVSLIEKAYAKLDKTGDGKVTVEDMEGVYDVKRHPKFLSGELTKNDIFKLFLRSFESKDHVDGVLYKLNLSGRTPVERKGGRKKEEKRKRKMLRKPEDDSWAFVPIGAPFPEDPVRVRGEMNQYVALWYKNGVPLCGRAWNNGGVVECSFPFRSIELTAHKDLGGQIQILTNPAAPDPIASYKARRFWYEWVPYRRRLEPQYAMVRCGNTSPILMVGPKNENFVGNLDLMTEIACYSNEGKAHVKEGGILDYHVICRNHNTPPGWDAPPTAKKKVVLMEGMEDDWVDRRVHDAFPPHAIQALGRKLKNEDGTQSFFSVCLWYKHGEPVMGRCWEDRAGHVQAAFGWDGKEFIGDVGSIQVLRYDTDEYEYEYEYQWMPYADAVAKKDGYRPVHVGDASPCVIKTPQGHERLGQVKLSKEQAGVAFGGKEEIYKGPLVQSFLILCRKP